MSVFCSSCPALLGTVHDLPRRAPGVLWQHLHRRVATLCQHLAVGQFGVAAFSEAAMPERCERQFVAKASGADDLFDLTTHVREVRLIRLRPCRPWSALAPIPAQHEAADAVAFDGVELGHQLGINRHTCIVEQRYPALLIGLVIDDADHIRARFRAIMRHVESRKDVGLALEPFPANQRGGRERAIASQAQLH